MNTQPDTSTTAGKVLVMQAHAEGKRVQFQYCKGGGWGAAYSPNWNWAEASYRIHPDDLNPPKLRAWKPEEVPVGALLSNGGGWRGMILAASQTDILTTTGLILRWESFGSAFETYKHSTDGGKTWKPCGVFETV